MTPTTLQTVGRALFGPCWQRELARQLDVSDRTVNRWATGVHAIPEGVRGELAELCRVKSEELWFMAGVLSQELSPAAARIMELDYPSAPNTDTKKAPVKQSSPELSTLAAKMMDHEDPDVRSLAASVLSQDETEG